MNLPLGFSSKGEAETPTGPARRKKVPCVLHVWAATAKQSGRGTLPAAICTELHACHTGGGQRSPTRLLRCCRPHVHVHVYIRYRDAWKDGYTPCIRRIESPWSSCARHRSAHSPPWRHRRGLRQEDNQNSIVLADEFEASLASQADFSIARRGETAEPL